MRHSCIENSARPAAKTWYGTARQRGVRCEVWPCAERGRLLRSIASDRIQVPPAARFGQPLSLKSVDPFPQWPYRLMRQDEHRAVPAATCRYRCNSSIRHLFACQPDSQLVYCSQHFRGSKCWDSASFAPFGKAPSSRVAFSAIQSSCLQVWDTQPVQRFHEW